MKFSQSVTLGRYSVILDFFSNKAKEMPGSEGEPRNLDFQGMNTLPINLSRSTNQSTLSHWDNLSQKHMVYPVDSSAYMLQEMKTPIYKVRKIKFINYIMQLVRVERHSVILKLLLNLREKMFKLGVEPKNFDLLILANALTTKLIQVDKLTNNFSFRQFITNTLSIMMISQQNSP